MRQRLSVELEDGTELEVVSDGRDIRAWESATGQSWLTSELSYTQLVQLAYHAAVRTGAWDGDEAKFLEVEISTRARSAREVADPTRPADTGSSLSP